jgi:hypothetical protein
MGVISVNLGALALLLPSLACQNFLPWPCTASRREFAACVEVVAAVAQIYLCFTPSSPLHRGNPIEVRLAPARPLIRCTRLVSWQLGCVSS